VAAVLRRATAATATDRFRDVAAFVAAFSAVAAPSGTPAAVPSNPGDATGGRAPVRNPYKGLRPFVEADAGVFFGRDRLVGELVDRLARPGTDGRFVGLVGPSGSGKSSVARAGLVPALRAGAAPGSDRWFVVTMLPGRDPFGELEAALLRNAVNPPASQGDQLTSSTEGLGRTIKRILPNDETELLLVIDQFEELFTLVEDEDTRIRFLDGLVAAVTDPRARLRVVATLRGDFYDRPLRYPGIAELFPAHHVAVMPLSGHEIDQAVSGPARRVDVALEPGLVSTIVADVAEHPTALPLMQYALAELFDHRSDGILTAADYHAIGGVTGALSRRADELHDDLSPAGQSAARLLFSRLVTLGEGVADTRRRTPRAELLAVGGDPDAMSTVIDRYGAARLLSFDRDPETREPTVEIAHEALLTRWARLRAWIDDDRDGLRIVRHLTAAAA
jgi:hypothetical protein